MLQVYNEHESELLCKMIDTNGVFYALFKDENYYSCHLIVADNYNKDLDVIPKIFDGGEGASCFYIEMNDYLRHTVYDNFEFIADKIYVLAVINDSEKYQDDYFEQEDNPYRSGIFKYFYTKDYEQLDSDSEIAKLEKELEKYYDLRMKSKCGDITDELPTKGKYYESQVTLSDCYLSAMKAPSPSEPQSNKKEITVDLDFINDI